MRRAFLRRVPNRTAESVLAEPARIEAVLLPSDEDTAIDDDSQIMLVAYELIDIALEPDAFLERGGTPVGDIVFGAGPARVLTSANVRKLAAKLALTTPADLGKFYGQEMFLPTAKFPTTAQAIAEYSTLKHFVTEAARAEAAIVVTVE